MVLHLYFTYNLSFFLCTGHPWIQIGGVAPDKPLDSAVLSRLKQFSAMNKLKKIAIRVCSYFYFQKLCTAK